jgi:hypothetical protein
MSLILDGTNGVSDIDGTAATPAIRGTDTNTGIFFGSDIIGFSEGGAEVARFNADAQFVAAAGTALLPVITTTGDVNTGIFFPAADTIAFSEGGTEVARFNSSGNLQTLGTISVGNATPSTSGAGITFPASQSASSDANTLDDYEEGTWTPTATSQGGSITSYSANGSYVKIGKTVFVRAEIILTTVGTASGRLDGGGLPFIERGERPFVALARENAATGNSFMCYGANGATTFQLTALTNVGAITWNNGYGYVFTATYLTD